MEELALFEMKCSKGCGKISLQERSNEHENICPYCGEDTDYAPGKIEPVAIYTPRSE